MGRYKSPYSLYKRGKYWYYRTYTAEGVRTSGISTGKTTKTAAKELCDSLYLAGRLYQSEQTFGQYSEGFYDPDGTYFRDRTEECAFNTIENYNKIMKNYLLPYWRNIKLKDIKYSDLKNYRAGLLQEGRSPSSVRGIMSCFKHIIDTAARDGLIPQSPFSLLEGLTVPTVSRDAFTLEEVKYLYDSMSEEFKPIILVMALLGLRVSEAVGIPYNEIKKSPLGFEYIDLKKQLSKKSVIGVKQKSERPVLFIPELKPLFGFDDSRVSALYRAFEPIKKTIPNAEERLLCFHSLRHFFITSAKSSGILESKIEFMAGHSLRGISATYTNYKAEDLVEVLDWQKKTYNFIIGL